MIKQLKAFFTKLLKLNTKPQPKISLLIPVSKSNSDVRKRTLKWLLKYWKYELPAAEVVMGYSNSKIFCKGEALNNAAAKATGKVLVIIDADAYIQGSVITNCADLILENLNNHLWFVPYRNLYRLNKNITQAVLHSDPSDPFRVSNPPAPEYIDTTGSNSNYGHRYGAMIMMFPREALTTVGSFDTRFKGWGGEDVALLRALDTLYGKHKTSNNAIMHLWHPVIGDSYKTRMWQGQDKPNPNTKLAMEYHRATRHPDKMRALVDAKNNI